MMSISELAPTHLSDYAERINFAVQAAEGSAISAMQHALAAGNLLSEAKKAVGHGAWEKWLTANCIVAPRTARAYMKLAATLPMLDELERQRVAELPVREAVRAIATPARNAAPSGLGRKNYAEAHRIGVALSAGSVTLRNAARELQAGRGLKVGRVAVVRQKLLDAIEALDRLVAANSDAASTPTQLRAA